MPDFRKLQGWIDDPKAVERYLNDPDNKHPVFSVAAQPVIRNYQRVDTFLYELLTWAFPDYARGAQALGDCSSHATELDVTILTCKKARKARKRGLAKIAATEPIYGGARVEIPGRKVNKSDDGSVVAYCANWVRKFGVLYRQDYSAETGNAEHDLSKYSGQKAKNWGYYGCGGKNDKGLLDDVARKMPVKTTSHCSGFEDIAAGIAGSKCPAVIGSRYGSDMVRDKHGFAKWNDGWNHALAVIAVRFGSHPGALLANSWGPRTSRGPKWPETMPDNIAGFTWWAPAEHIDRMCRDGDAHIIGDLDGWEIDPFDWNNALN